MVGSIKEAPGVTFRVGRDGRKTAWYMLISMGLGHSRAAGTSLASVLKEGKESPLQKQQQRQRLSLPISSKCHLEARTEDSTCHREC